VNVLVVGSGGREHALVWKLLRSPSVRRVIACPGNAGIEMDAARIPVRESDTDEIAAVCVREHIDLVVVGPELPLAMGLADTLRQRGIRVFGPGKKGARLESSKAFAKEFMARHGLPTAAFGIAGSRREAQRLLNRFGLPCVIKLDGLAAGKGVQVCEDPGEADRFLARIFNERAFGPEPCAIIEARLEGAELSYLVVTDGSAALPLAPARDYKRALDGNRGLNTGGMGSVSCDALADESLRRTIDETLVAPALRGLAQESIEYRGVLYFGLMLTKEGPMILEFNVRFGDPETQVILPRLAGDLGEIVAAAAEGELRRVRADWTQETAVCVVIASGGYPGSYVTGKTVSGLDQVQDAVVFHAGTARDGDRVVTAGGRVFGVTATGASPDAARRRAYAAASLIQFEGAFYRRDIAAEFSSAEREA